MLTWPYLSLLLYVAVWFCSPSVISRKRCSVLTVLGVRYGLEGVCLGATNSKIKITCCQVVYWRETPPSRGGRRYGKNSSTSGLNHSLDNAEMPSRMDKHGGENSTKPPKGLNK